MSNQFDNGFQGSQPFITDNEYKSLSLDQLRYILNQKKKTIQKSYKELSEKEKIIRDIRRLDKRNEKVKKGVDIKKKYKKKKASIKTVAPSKKKKIKTFDEYFEECIKNKEILKDTPSYFREALERAIKEYDQDKAYFNTYTFTNLKSTDVDELIYRCTESILGQMEMYAERSSNWVFKEVVKLEIHTVEFNPAKGSSYIVLPDWIKNKKAIVNIKNKDDKCFLWCILRYIYPKESHEERVEDLKKYEFSLNTKGITFPMNVKDITKFEKLNPELPGINGVYPYDYVSSLDKLSETCLPPKEEFYSKLNDEDITDDDYQHAINVWNTFGCKSIRDYHNLYLKSDVLLLADVFENFRATCLKHYKLDPVHYYTSPGLAWDACLETTGQHLQLLHDYDMLMMFERGIRGGITHISKRYAVANNKYMKGYNPDEESSYIQYLDANNLYGWAMSQNLATHGFKWMKTITKEKVEDILEKANHCMLNMGRKGYIFEVDLEYPPHLWDSHNDYPLAPEKMIVNGVEKLICHFKPRKNYVAHYRTLRQCLELGMRITAVHRGISFYQRSWMEPYIRKNTELRKIAANSFEKDFFKLMNNSVFGKTIENIRKRQNIELVDNRKKAVKLTSRPNFDRCTIFDKNLIAVHMKKTEIYFNKPVYVGQAILDLSKTLMFNFHYKYIPEKYGNRAELLMTDTDSLMYQIKTKDFYKDIKPDMLTKFDTSDYPTNHKSGIPPGVNKKVIGMFKDEVAGKQITRFVRLRPKLYSFDIEEDKEVRKCKGIKKNVVKKGLKFDDYVKCLFSGEKEMRKMKIIRSEKHEIYSKEVNKIALSNEDDKRKIFKDNIHTLALR
ncbi:unnamed protein product [Porites lobata]|uniref:DNA-directed DNA polymerase n=1 Tax=Porites lobata TaxID=104759 RepID=A0ABN8R1J6_9CNID|nr:unnamed protein product [Porites lobata]